MPRVDEFKIAAVVSMIELVRMQVPMFLIFDGWEDRHFLRDD